MNKTGIKKFMGTSLEIIVKRENGGFVTQDEKGDCHHERI